MRAFALILSLLIVPLALWMARHQLPAHGAVTILGGALATGVAWFAGVAVWMPVPLKELASGLVTRSLLGAALFALASSLLVLLVGGAPLWPSLVVAGALVCIVLGAATALWYLPMRRVFMLRQALADEASRLAVADELVASFEPAEPGASRMEKTRRLIRALSAARVLSDAKLWSHGLRIVDRLDLDGIAPAHRATAQSWRAVLQLYDGDRAGAFASLTEASSLTSDANMLRNLRLTMALSTALEGRGRDALAQLAETPAPRDPRLRRAYQLARCEALAADGDLDSARRVLAELGEHEADVRARLKALGGAAAAL